MLDLRVERHTLMDYITALCTHLFSVLYIGMLCDSWTHKENLLWKFEFGKLDEIFDVDGEVFSIF